MVVARSWGKEAIGSYCLMDSFSFARTKGDCKACLLCLRGNQETTVVGTEWGWRGGLGMTDWQGDWHRNDDGCWWQGEEVREDRVRDKINFRVELMGFVGWIRYKSVQKREKSRMTLPQWFSTMNAFAPQGHMSKGTREIPPQQRIVWFKVPYIEWESLPWGVWPK